MNDNHGIVYVTYMHVMVVMVTQLQVLKFMKDHPSSDDIQYVGCLFMINFQLKLPSDVRQRTKFDSRLFLFSELSNAKNPIICKFVASF